MKRILPLLLLGVFGIFAVGAAETLLHETVFNAPKKGFFCRSEHFFGRKNTYEYKGFRAEVTRGLPLIYAATQKNIHIRRGDPGGNIQ